MSQRCTDIIVSDELFSKLSGRILIEPSDEVFRGGLKQHFHMDLSRDADAFRAKCSSLLVKGYEPYVTSSLRDLVEQYNLLAFAYLFNNENCTKHIRVVMTTARSIKLCWVRDTNPHWPYLQLCDWNEKEIVGMIDIENTGWYTPYIMNKNALGDKFNCSRFDIKYAPEDPKEKFKVVTVDFDKKQSKWVELPKTPFEIYRDDGMRMLEEELRRFILNFEATD